MIVSLHNLLWKINSLVEVDNEYSKAMPQKAIWIIIAILSSIFGVLAWKNVMLIALLPVTLITIILIYVFIQKPKVWLFVVSLTFFEYFGGGGGGVSAIDIALAVFYLGGLLVWFIGIIVIKREKIVFSFGDFIILATFIVLLSNIYTAIEHDTSFLQWAREYSRGLFLLYYFPFKYHLRTQKDWLPILTILMLVVGKSVLNSYFFYKNLALISTYAYQIGGLRQSVMTMSMGAIFCFGILFSVNTSRNAKVLGFCLSILFTAGVIITTARTYLLGLLAGMLLLFLLIKFKDKVKFIVLLIISIATIWSGAFLVFGNRANVLVKLFLMKTGAVKTEAKSGTVLMRLREAQKMTELLLKEPLTGQGLDVTYHYYDPVMLFNWRHQHSHSGWIGVLFRLGIPIGILYYLAVFLKLFEGINYSIRYRRRDGIDWWIISPLLAIIVLFISHTTETQFFGRDSVFGLAICFALISAYGAYPQLRSEHSSTNT